MAEQHFDSRYAVEFKTRDDPSVNVGWFPGRGAPPTFAHGCTIDLAFLGGKGAERYFRVRQVHVTPSIPGATMNDRGMWEGPEDATILIVVEVWGEFFKPNDEGTMAFEPWVDL